jgi:hypothetical protein
MSSESSTLSLNDRVNTRLVQKLAEVAEAYNSNSTGTQSSRGRGRRPGIFIAVEDIPRDLEDNDSDFALNELNDSSDIAENM